MGLGISVVGFDCLSGEGIGMFLSAPLAVGAGSQVMVKLVKHHEGVVEVLTLRSIDSFLRLNVNRQRISLVALDRSHLNLRRSNAEMVAKVGERFLR